MDDILIVGTADTKGAELAYLRSAVASAGARAVVVDVGTRTASIPVDVSAREVAAYHPDGVDTVLEGDDRGLAVAAMTKAFEAYLSSASGIAGVIGIGGSGGTSIVTAGMRALAIGIPKIMVSTLASGDVAAFIDVSDIVMMPSVTDLNGLNSITAKILQNAASAVVAMAAAPQASIVHKPSLGLTMFGVTTTAVTAIVDRLADDYDCLVFHATGTGGRAMEKLAESGLVAGMLDVTTTEVCDLLFGGVLAASPDRFDVVAKRRLPYVGSVGALDMINFWGKETLPKRYRNRLIYEHNANVTLVRTTVDECCEIGAWIGAKLARCDGPVRFLIPEKGVSALDVEGGAFFDPEADAALFEAIEQAADWSGRRRLVRLPLHINDPQFAEAVVSNWNEIKDERTEHAGHHA